MSNSSIQSKVAKVLEWDLTKPKAFLVLRQGMDPKYVEELELQYKRYIALIAAFPDTAFPISNPVDELWHAHILFTDDYIEMSQVVKGAYIGHLPTLNEEERADLEPSYFSCTLAMYKQMFGEPSLKFWPVDSASICWSKTNCTPEQLENSYRRAQAAIAL